MKPLFILTALGALAISTVGCGASYQCCKNGAYWECGSKEAATACAEQNDYTDCTRISSKDNACLAGN